MMDTPRASHKSAAAARHSMMFTLGSRKRVGRGPRQCPGKTLRGHLESPHQGTGQRWGPLISIHILKCLHKMMYHRCDAMVAAGPHR